MAYELLHNADIIVGKCCLCCHCCCRCSCMLPVSFFGCRKLPTLQVTWGKPNSCAATSGAGPGVCGACLSLPPSLPLLLEWHLISMMSLFHLQLKNYAKWNRSRGQRQRKRQAQTEIASERCFCQQWKGISGLYTCMYRWYTSTFNTHKYLSDFALE